MPQRVLIVTGTRAEFGLLQTVMQAVAAHPELTLITAVTGAHFVSGTWQDVRAAGFTIDAKVPMQKPGETGRQADAFALGRGVTRLAEVYTQHRPDWVVVLGDRIEAFAAASAASIGGVHLAHLHGGDRAEGVADEAMRHAISKLAHLHLPATAQSARRLVRMGEPRERVLRVGSPAVDGLREVEASTNAPELVVLMHPTGRDDSAEYRDMTALLRATSRRGRSRLVLQPNHDPGRDGIAQAIADHAAPPETVDHLPRAEFLAKLKGARAIVGNSSAGLIEAAVLKTPCLDLGSRQRGRQRPNHAVHVDQASTRAIQAGLRHALALDQTKLRHPYGQPGVGRRVAEALAQHPAQQVPLAKQNSY